jgi:anti-sigma B factor antagonist
VHNPTSQSWADDAQPTQLFDIDVERPPDHPVVAHVFGPVDLLTAPALRMCVDDNVVDDNGLVLDLSGVDFLAASGLTVLTDTERRASQERLAWALVANTRQVIRPLDLLGLRERLPTYDTVPRAVAAVATGTRVG